MQKSEIIKLCLEVFVFINLLVFVHEAGRFLAAKWRGLKITRFRLGLGQPIWQTGLGKAVLEVGWVPLGGYIFLPQLISTRGEPTDKSSEGLPAIAPRDKLIVALAGPICGLALVIATAVLFEFVFVLLEALTALNLLILVHELGHFLAGKWRGLKVERFSIWFGTPVCKFEVKGVEYCLGWIPAGGYVSLPQMATMEAIEGKTEEKAEQLPNVSPLNKIIVAFAGPLFSFLLAVLFAVIVWQVGKPDNTKDNKPILGWVVPDGPAWKAGLRPGDTIKEIDGHPVNLFGSPDKDSIVWRVITSESTNIAVTYVRDDKQDTVHIKPFRRDTKWYERKALRQILISPVEPAIIYHVVSNSPAAVAGLKSGDEIVALNGEKILSYHAVGHVQLAQTNKDAPPVTFTVRRGEEQFERTFKAEKPLSPPDMPPAFGILSWRADTNVALIYPKPWDQIKSSANQIFATIGAVVSKKSDIGVQQLGGAVMIIRVYTTLFQDEDGWRLVLWFSVLLNVNLALLNLLPLPVLDGGHILLSLIEAARRRPVSPRILNYVQSGFAILLIGFMVYIAFFDAGDWIRSSRKSQPIVFAPKN